MRTKQIMKENGTDNEWARMRWWMRTKQIMNERERDKNYREKDNNWERKI